jgi:trehalose 6-phosphate phosphatase
VALHGRYASEADASAVLPQARAAAERTLTGDFRILGGYRFVEVAPAQAHKGQSVEWLLEHAPTPGARLAYLGDDDKDEEAFGVVLARGGTPIVVGPPRGPTLAVARVAGPEQVHEFLEGLAAARQHS